MKTEIESAFKNFITVIEAYREIGLRINEYYKDNSYKDDLSKAKTT